MSIKLKGSTDGSVSLDAPADTSPSGTDVSLTLPTSAGSANQFIKNGSTAGELEHSSMVETSTGGIGIGTSTLRTNLVNGSLGAQFQVEGTDHNTSSVSLIRNSSDNDNPYLTLGKSRGTGLNSNTIVQDDDALGTIAFLGNDGSSFLQAASISAEVDGTPGTDDMPGALVFATTADGASSPTTRARIFNSGADFYGSSTIFRVRDSSDNTAFGGSLSGGWTSWRAQTTGGIHHFHSNEGGTRALKSYINQYGALTSVSDYRLKKNVVSITGAIDSVKQLNPVTFNWNWEEDTDLVTHGFLAHEFATVLPKAVEGEKDQLKSDGSMFMQMMTEEKAVPLLTAALQEAIAKIETLETKVAALEAAS